MTENDLMNLGVSAKHIQWLKDTNVKSLPMDGYCHEVKKPSAMELVSVKKIVGLGARGEKGQSWWKHFSMEKGDLNRLPALIESLNKIGLNSFRHTFQQEEYSVEIKMEYYADEDIYFVNAGQHRVTMAKVVDAPYMLADVALMEINEDKEKEYTSKKELLSQINELLDKLNFEVKGDKVYWQDVYTFQSSLNANFTERPLLSNTMTLKAILGLLESFSTAVREVEDFQKALSMSKFAQYKLGIKRKFGLDKQLNNFEKVILELQSKGWKHKLN